MDLVHIYVLLDNLGELRYVGITNDPKIRLSQHCCYKEANHKGNWIQKLKRNGHKPYMQVIQTLPAQYAHQAEIYWIRYFKEQGCRLVNSTDGGGGTVGLKMSEDVKEFLSQKAQKRWSVPEERQKQRNRVLGTKQSEVVVKNRIKKTTGLKRTQEQRQNISKSLKGRTFSQEWVNKMSKAKLGKKLSEETKTKKMGLARINRRPIKCINNGKTYDCISDAARDLNLNNSNIVKVLKGKYKAIKGHKFVYILT